MTTFITDSFIVNNTDAASDGKRARRLMRAISHLR